MAQRQFLAGHRVTYARSSAEARSALAAGRFGVVLLDYDLPDGKRMALVGEVRARARPPLIIATSSHAYSCEELLGAGAAAACPKTHFGELRDTIATLVERRAGREPGA